MNTQKKIVSFAAVLIAILSPLGTVRARATEDAPSAADVEYVKVGNYIANWGTRGAESKFLSVYAEAFYTGAYTYETLSENEGGTSQSDAHESELYKALQAMMKTKHTHITGYKETNNLYRYTDCQKSDHSTISSFYSGTEFDGTWVGGNDSPWNKEHTWPNSKGLGGSDENDIMMLRPTVSSENSSRGNKGYGESAGYYEPADDVKGDCARIVLYTYTRWGNTQYMWGSAGVMESLEVLLSWMESDPVDTWEMGRNDAVQAITGTRNVFVDYPEYAWLLFGEDIPENMPTPSGIAQNPPVASDSDTDTATDSDTASDSDITTDSDTVSDSDITTDSDTVSDNVCEHVYGEPLIVTREDGTKAEMRVCKTCGFARYREIEEGGCNSSVSGFAVTGLLTSVCTLLCIKRKR